MPAAKKTKRSYSGASKKTTSTRGTAGYSRTGGYYGRFGGSGGELKFFDTALSFNYDTTGEVPATGQLVLIPQGVTESTRVGRKCVIKSIQMRGFLTYSPGAAADAFVGVVMYLVQDTQCNGAAATVTDVLTSNALGTALRNIANSERFKILKSWRWVFNATAGVSTAYDGQKKNFEYYKTCSIPLEFSSTTGAITELRSNNLFLLAGSDGGGDDLVSMTGNCRVRFSD